MIRNIDDCKYSEKDGEYGGASCLKNGLIIDGEDWLVKYPKNAAYLARHEEMSYTNDAVSEYLGSHVYEILGYPVHKTELFERNGKIVVGCKDFLQDGERLVEIRTIKNSANNRMSEILDRDFVSTGSAHMVNFDEIMLHLEHNNLLRAVPGIKERFFDQIVVDAFINNSDRNNGNWGVIRKKGMPDRLAPIFDNGGSFNGKTPDSRLLEQMQNNGIKSNVLNGISVYGRESNFLVKELLNLNIEGLQESLARNVPLIKEKLPEIMRMVEGVDEKACSRIRKDFYIKSLEERVRTIMEPALEHAKEVNHSLDNDEFVKKSSDEREALVRILTRKSEQLKLKTRSESVLSEKEKALCNEAINEIDKIIKAKSAADIKAMLDNNTNPRIKQIGRTIASDVDGHKSLTSHAD